MQYFGNCCTFAKENNIQALTSTTDAITNEQIQGCLMNREWKPLVVRRPFFIIMAKFSNELTSFQNIPRDLVFDSTLSDRARFVYCFMACKPNDWNFFLEPMAKEIGYSVDTLRKYVNELVLSGWLEKGEQEREKGVFGATQYTLKATKNTDTGFFRHGKTPIQHNIDNIQIIDVDKEKEIDKSISKKNEFFDMFEAFVIEYKRLYGKHTGGGAKTLFKEFTKRHKDWRDVIPLLMNALNKEDAQRNKAKKNNEFFPSPKMLSTYLGKQRAWETWSEDEMSLFDDKHTKNSPQLIIDGQIYR